MKKSRYPLNLKTIILGFVLLVAATTARSVEIKGLKLGSVYSPNQLADLFEMARCPPEDDVTRTSKTIKSFTCEVPISYLGIKTTAAVRLTTTWMATSISIEIPRERLDEVENILTRKYGKPDQRRGDFERKVPGLNGGPEQSLYANCTKWNSIPDGGAAELCKSHLLPFNGNGPYILYRLSTSSQLDSNDL